MKTRRHKRGGLNMDRYLYEFNNTLTPNISILQSSAVQSYLKKIKRCEKKSRDPSSLSYLIDRDLSQSACIRIGNVIEDILNLFLAHHLEGTYERRNIQKNTKGERQKDILFINDETNHVIYAELKANINLDTQKSKATVQSLLKVIEDYTSQEMNIQAYLVSLRYLHTDDIPSSVAKKYKDVQLIGLSDFITEVLNVEPFRELQSYETYSEFLSKIADYIE
jgi:hypothetical protein